MTSYRVIQILPNISSTLTIALELPLSLVLSTKVVVSMEHLGRLDELATDIVQSLYTIWHGRQGRLLCLWTCGWQARHCLFRMTMQDDAER